MRLRLFGEHNVTNALAAAALAGELGLALPEVADGLSAADGPEPVADGGHASGRTG